MKHVLEAQQFSREDLEELFSIADKLHGTRNKSLDGKIMAALFYEPSTRTRMSFESAMLRLGGSVISTENAKEFSSAAKGETIEDTMQMVNHYADVAVIRHYEKGMCERAASASRVPVINAGDGPGQHPTQALLDLYTILKEVKKIDGIHLMAVGDLKNGRTIRSLSYLLSKFNDITLTFVSPKELRIGEDIKTYLKEKGVTLVETDNLKETLGSADVVYMTRIQKERFLSEVEYMKHKGKYVLTKKEVDEMKDGSIIMHPLPRVDEIDKEVDSTEKALYFKEAGYGVTIRMALLSKLLA